MKGLIISITVLLLYIIFAAFVAWCVRPRRHLKLFLLTFLPWIPGYFLLYSKTPPDLGFLPRAWICSNQWVDLFYGFSVLLLNCHTMVDCFFGICGGFSVSLLVALLQSPGQALSTKALINLFQLPDGSDRIYSWRIPDLERRGYIRRSPDTNTYSLTAKGRRAALVAFLAKRLMNLGEGG